MRGINFHRAAVIRYFRDPAHVACWIISSMILLTFGLGISLLL